MNAAQANKSGRCRLLLGQAVQRLRRDLAIRADLAHVLGRGGGRFVKPVVFPAALLIAVLDAGRLNEHQHYNRKTD